MKKINLMLTAAIIVTGFTACKNSATDEAKQDVMSLNNYVDSVANVSPVYTSGNWSAIDNGYQDRAMRAEKRIAELEASDKEKIAESKAKYATLRTNYEVKIKEQETETKEIPAARAAVDYRQVLRNRLFGEGKIGADMKFEFVTAGNILSVYKNFVNTVADNKDNYTREDWDEVKVLYEALDTRKNAVEKDLAGSDNRKIAGLKVRFASIKATNRGGTKGAENEAAKQ
jgi:hypothetical protein